MQNPPRPGRTRRVGYLPHLYASYASVFFTRSAVIGRWRSRLPVSWNTALAIAGATSDHADLTHAAGRIVGGEDLGMDLRHLAHPHDRIAVEVRGLDGAVLDGQLLDQSGTQAV